MQILGFCFVSDTQHGQSSLTFNHMRKRSNMQECSLQESAVSQIKCKCKTMIFRLLPRLMENAKKAFSFSKRYNILYIKDIFLKQHIFAKVSTLNAESLHKILDKIISYLCG